MTTLFETKRELNVVAMVFPDLRAGDAELAMSPEEATPKVRDADEQHKWMARCEQARADGAEEAREACEARFGERLEVERTAVAMACASVARARDRYFAEVEAEVVRLAVSIARRILHREVTMDASVLAGVVRAALAKLSDPEGAVLFVAPADADLWKHAARAAHLTVEQDASLVDGCVQLRSTAGVAELGLEAQLVEIERGFSDLLARRPA